MLLFAILISLQIDVNIDWNKHLSQYNQQGNSPESIWATTLLYYSAPDSVRDNVYQSIESSLIKDGIDAGDDFEETIEIINQTTQDESLLLLSLLLEEDQEKRTTLFETFYSENQNGELFEINSFVKDREVIDINLIEVSKFQFHHFLLSFYLNRSRVVSDSFFEMYSDYWLPRLENNVQQENSDLFVATLLKSLYEINEYNEIITLYDDSVDFTDFPPSNLKRNFFWGLDFVHSYLGQLDKSLEIQRSHTIPLSNFIDDQNGLSSIYSSQGAYLYQLGNYQKARVIFTDLLTEIDELSPARQVGIYNNLSLIYFKTGESSRYVETQLKALEIAKEAEIIDQQNRIYRNLHIFYRKYQNWDLAQQYIDRASELAEANGNTNDLISINISKAVFASQYLNDNESAYSILNETEQLVDDQTEPRLKVRILRERSVLYKHDQRWLDSRDVHHKIIEIAADQSESATYLESLVELAFIHFQMEEFAQSEQRLKEFRAHDITILDFEILVLAQTIQAKVFAENGNITAASKEFADVTDLVLERARNTSEQETGYWNIESEYLTLFESYADFLIDNGNVSAAIQLLDRVKTINDASLVDNPLVQAGNLSDSELTQDKNLKQEMDQIRKRIFTAQDQDRLALQNQLELLSAQRRSLLGNQQQTLADDPIKIWSLQRKLRDDQLLIHITDINSNYYVSQINRESTQIRKIELDADTQHLFEQAVESIITGNTNLQQLFEIGEILDINSIDQNVRSIVLIPDGFFHQLPISVLPVRQPDSPFSYGSAHYLIENKDIYTINSLNELMHNSPKQNFEHDYAGFGVSDFNNDQTDRNLVSLPRAPIEINNIVSDLHRFSSSIGFTNHEATTESFKTAAGNSRILHLATHSEVSESDPLFSRLHFYSEGASQENPFDNGQLFAYELFNLNLQNELVMLNSCESGGDRYLQGSGIMGINRALRYAGVQSLVLNAWSVNDQFAADFAELFYSYINSGKTKSEALQLAKIDFIKTKNANPHYWGSYILNGNNRPLINHSESNGSNYLLALLFLFAVVSLRRVS